MRALIYFPPKQGKVSTDTVTYKLAGKPDETVTVKIDLRDGPGAFGSDEIYNESFKAVFVLFIIAVLVESGENRHGQPGKPVACRRIEAT